MNRFIITLCSVSMIGMIFRSLAAKDSYKRIISITVSLAAVLSAMSAFPGYEGEEPELSAPPENKTDPGLDLLLDGRYISETERAVAAELDRLLKERGYSVKNIVITCVVDEYDNIVIDKAEATAAETECAEAEAFLRELLPDSSITVHPEKAESTDESEYP